MPTPPLLEVFGRTRHQIFDADDVGQDVVSVVADERVAVDENRRKGTDGEDALLFSSCPMASPLGYSKAIHHIQNQSQDHSLKACFQFSTLPPSRHHTYS